MGLATARAFAQAGAAVGLADIDETAVSTAVKEFTDAGHRALALVCNVTDEDQVAAAVDSTVEAFGRLDMAYNNAGIMSPPTDAADESAEQFDRVHNINLRGIWAAMKHELRHMRDQGSGAIVNCSSLGGLVGNPGRAAYHATKHGVIGLTKSAALELRPARRADQRRLPRHHRDPHGRRHGRRRRTRPHPGRSRPGHRPPRHRRRDRPGRPVAVQQRRQLGRGEDAVLGHRLTQPRQGLPRWSSRL